MSEKGFGDHINRSVVKNPLLSTAVVGLSIEDLTHNAVLLPAVPSQELITRQDKQCGSQTTTLANTDLKTYNLPSGDTNSNIVQSNILSNIDSNTPHSQTDLQSNELKDVALSAQSKASVRSDDDFDVNEYFARLQGTRYVSAPLNRKEDQNANLPVEENLEEINLNEPEKIEEVHSITADIAQNFSQLPTVLPQVASAVFSSFSNMLNLKSREQTPDVGYRLEEMTPIGSYKPEMPVSEVSKSVAPPPLKEPPLSGSSSYRITTKKKVYAQIPGLTGDSHIHNPAASHAVPYFTPDATNTQYKSEPTVDIQKEDFNINYFTPDNTQPNIEPKPDINKNNYLQDMTPHYPEPAKDQTVYNFFTPIETSSHEITYPEISKNQELLQNPSQHHTFQTNTSSAPIIPPPPMFSNLPGRDSQSSVGRTVLPPSVARRIAANQPLIKPQPPTMIPQDNIFVPIFTDHNQADNLQDNNSQERSTSLVFDAAVTNTYSSDEILPPNSKQTISRGFLSSDADKNIHSESTDTVFPTISAPVTEFFIPKDIIISPDEGQTGYNQPSNKKAEELTFQQNIAQSVSSFPSNKFIAEFPTQEPPIAPKTVEVSNRPLPMFYDPSSLQQRNENKDNLPTIINHDFKNVSPPEPPKTILEPPKISGSLNYRMTKKKPQYYSGPIEGVGSISNNVKPTLNPVKCDYFQGALFTPSQQIADISSNQKVSSTDTAPQTDFSTSFNNPDPTYGFTNVPQQQYHTDYNTVFDLSRPSTENYEQPQTEAKGFGLLGSLKSKLSALDINKIQNTVTTFFDPAYNEIKDEHKQELILNQTYGHADHYKDTSSFDIFVGSSNITQSPPSHFPSDYSSLLQHNPEVENNKDSKYRQETTNYPTWSATVPSLQDIYPAHSVDNTIISGENYEMSTNHNTTNAQPSYMIPTLPVGPTGNIDFEQVNTKPKEDLTRSNNAHFVSSVTKINNPLSLFSAPLLDTQTTTLDDKIIESVTNLVLGPSPHPSSDKNEVSHQETKETAVDNFVQPPIENTFKLFDSHPLLPSDQSVVSEKTFIVKEDLESEYYEQDRFEKRCSALELESSSYESFPVKTNYIVSDTVQESLERNDSILKYFEQPSSNSSIHLFDFPSLSKTALSGSTSTEISSFENVPNEKVVDSISHEPHEKIIANEDLGDNVSELNICITCREVSKNDEKGEVEDLTTQLIENITAPIQLLNPVGAVLPISEVMPDVSPVEATTDPLCEKSHSATDSVTELIGNVNSDNKIPNFGWNTAAINDVLNSNLLTENKYNLQPDANTIRFVQNKSLLQNIPTNASDEIKAEFKNSHEELIIPQPLPIIPTAPPEEDNKSDESGLDVHSIEQDAKKDFLFYDEFVIEPSETDDDKIEFMERENSSEDTLPEVDTFTNRVERFKQMETVDNDEVFNTTAPSIPSSLSPSLTMASYFDTGNYAVENHYRNSLTSPSSFTSTNTSMRIPPGFEKEFSKRFPCVTSTGFLPDGHVTFIPDTTTQTCISPTLTFSQTHTTQSDIITHIATDMKPTVAIETILTNPIAEPILIADTERLPAFSSLTEQSKEETGSNEMPAETEADKPKSEENLLSDTKNIFASDSGPSATDENDEYNSFSRLSSYFSTPPKSDNAKSFFELSQSQDHYRHASIESNVKHFFETGPKNTETHNILDVHETRYQNTMDLVRDLATHKDVTPKVEVVRTVNYFTVAYDKHVSNNCIGEPSASVTLTDKDVDRIKTEKLKQNIEVNMTVEDVLRSCKNCCSLDTGCVRKINLECVNEKNVKCMNSGEEKRVEIGMDASRNSQGQSVTVNFMDHSTREVDDGVAIATENRTSSEYAPVKYHWFYRVDKDGQSTWRGFSVADSRALEIAYNSPDLDENTLVQTDGGRYDVNVVGRLRISVYWSEPPSNVMRCSWFYCNTDGRYVPYKEAVAEKLEEEYQHGITTGEWHRRLVLPDNELVVMHGPGVMVHFLQNSVDSFSGSPLFTFGKTVHRNPPKIGVVGDQTEKIDHLLFLVHGAGEFRHQKEKIQSMTRPRVVKRGAVESEIEDTEPSSIDHLLLLCHGVGSACDMRMRPVEAVVDDFRKTSMQLLHSHYKNSYDSGLLGRIEVLPISWHSSLHSGEAGVDKRLANITLDSIPLVRNFTNDTVLDVLFYTSPVFGQTIIDTVCKELNRIYSLFKRRNPEFKGGVSLGGHSLGSVILYDLLGHQTSESPSDSRSANKTYVQESAGSGQPMFQYPKLEFSPEALFAFGSPIAIFECVRGVDMLGRDFRLPTCKNFFNIFHPYDPIAYRIEPMIDPELRDVKPCLIPHHKGRKRMHLELKETMAKFGSDIKQKVIESIKNTWSSMWKSQPPTSGQLEKVVEEEMEKVELNDECKQETAQAKEATPEMLGKLNAGRRVDYVLQEAPFEMIYEYLFAMNSHVCYWESADTILLILREVYASLHVQPDCCVPQQSLTVQRERPVPQDGATTATPFEAPSTSRDMST